MTDSIAGFSHFVQNILSNQTEKQPKTLNESV